eukprot:g1294.t1
MARMRSHFERVLWCVLASICAAQDGGEGMEQLASLLGGLMGGLAGGGGAGASGGVGAGAAGGGDACAFRCPDRAHAMVQDPAYQLWSNGCGTGGMNMDVGFGFSPCCDAHDACYELCGMPKATCDRAFHKCMDKVCAAQPGGKRGKKAKECSSAKGMFTLGVGVFGCGPYMAGQQQACLCVPRARAREMEQQHVAGTLARYSQQEGNATARAQALLAKARAPKKKGKKKQQQGGNGDGVPQLLFRLVRKFPQQTLLKHGSQDDPNQPLIDSKTKHGTYKQQAVRAAQGGDSPGHQSSAAAASGAVGAGDAAADTAAAAAAEPDSEPEPETESIPERAPSTGARNERDGRDGRDDWDEL